MSKHENILGTVGNTPVVRINKLAPEGINLFVKIEAFNPLGSVKDRLALGVIEAAEKSGELKPGQTVVEATSGNTGIGLAMVCAQKGYPLVICMAESFSVERRKLMRFLGAKVVLTPAKEKGTGMVKKAKELADKNGWFLTRQFETDANPDMHEKTTAQEILKDFDGEALDYWVTGFGTGGTLNGVGRVLAKERPETKIVFIPKITGDAVAMDFIHEVKKVSGADAMKCARDLATQEGIFCGISCGATFATALEVCKEAPKGSTVLCMLPDTGERYLSTPLFGDVEAEMNEAELEIIKKSGLKLISCLKIEMLA